MASASLNATKKSKLNTALLNNSKRTKNTTLSNGKSKLNTALLNGGTNNGGIVGGIGYVGEKIGLGALSWAEGLVDFTVGGVASLTGNKAYAEQLMKNDWVNYADADEWYNPGKGWRVAGDVAQGVGNSLPSIGISAVVGIATGGLSFAGQATVGIGTTFLSTGLSAAGQGTKEAYQKTGKLTGKEWGYGALSGTIEGLTETASDLIGFGAGAARKAAVRAGGEIGKQATAKIAKESAEKIAENIGRESIGKVLAKSFLGEATEEAVSEILTPIAARMTYDPTAEINPFTEERLKEIGYAALVGGLSGMVMGGTTKVITNGATVAKGNQIVNNQSRFNDLMQTGKRIAETTNSNAELPAWKVTMDVYTELQASLAETDGKVETAKQRRLVAQLNNATAYASLSPTVYKAALDIVMNPQEYLNAFNGMYVNSETGNQVTVTADELTQGIDVSSGKALLNSLQTALETNTRLREIVVMEAAGRLMINSEEYSNRVQNYRGDSILSDRQIDEFRNSTNEQAKADMGAFLGVDVNTATNEEIREAYNAKWEEKYGIRENDLRNGGERLDGTNSGEQIPGMEIGAGENQSRAVQGDLTGQGIQSETRGDAFRVRNITGYRYNGEVTDDMRRAESIAKESGANIAFFDGLMKDGKGSYRGFFDSTTNTLYVSANNKNYTAEQIARHEITHKKIANGELNVDEVKKRIAENYDVDEIAEKYAEAYKGSGMTAEEVFEEIICDAEAGMNVFEEAGKSEEEVRQYGEVLAETKQAAEESNPRAPPTDANAAEKFSGEIKNDNYDYSKSFAEQIDDLKSGTFPRNDTLIMGGTPEVFKNIGLLPLPMTYTQQHAKEAIKNADGDHLGEVLLKRVPKALETPIAIIDSETVPGRIVAILELKNGNNNVIAAVEIEGTGRMHGKIIDSNLVVSTYSRENTISKLLKNAIVSEINNNRGIYYWDKKRTTNLVSVIGVQFPAVSSISDGYIHSITEFSKKVNGLLKNIFDTKQFKRWFGKSKVVNKDGTPKVMYRGDDNEIFVFDRSKSKASNLFGRGFYFTESESRASQYGKARPYYLNVRVPLSMNQNSISKEQFRNFVSAVFENEDYSPENYGYGATVDSVVNSVYGKGDLEAIQDISATAIGDLVEAVELFNKVNGTNYDGIILPGETVVFQSNQIKSATDNIGTFDGSNPDIRFSQEIDTSEIDKASVFTKTMALDRTKHEEKVIADYINDKYFENGGVVVDYKSTNDVMNEIKDKIARLANSREKNMTSEKRRTEAMKIAREIVNEARFVMESETDNPNAQRYTVRDFEDSDKEINSLRFFIQKDIINSFAESDGYKRANKQIGYTQARARETVDNIMRGLDEYTEMFNVKLDGIGKTTRYLYSYLNSVPEGYRFNSALKMADYILDNSLLYDAYENEASENNRQILNAISPYRGKLDLSAIRSENQQKYGKKNAIFAQWGTSKGGVTIDSIVNELNESLPGGITANNEADMFFEIVDKYTKARKELIEASKKGKLSSTLTEEQRNDFRQTIAKYILTAFDQSEPAFQRTFEKLQNESLNLKKQLNFVKKQNDTIAIIDKINEQKSNLFENASETPKFKFYGILGRFGRILRGGNISANTAKSVMQDLRTWYNESPAFIGADGQKNDRYSSYIADMIDSIADADIKDNILTDEQMKNLNTVMRYFSDFIRNYGKVNINGQLVEAMPLVKKYVTMAQNVKMRGANKVLFSQYLRKFADPQFVLAAADGFMGGFHTDMLNLYRDAYMDYSETKNALQSPVKQFLTENSKYAKSLTENVTFYGQTVPKWLAIACYMTSFREQAQAGLLTSQIVYANDKNQIVKLPVLADVDSFAKDGGKLVSDFQSGLEKTFNATDKQFIEIIQKGYEETRGVKEKTDKSIHGFIQTVKKGLYYPIRKYMIAKGIDSTGYLDEVRAAENISANKQTVQGARNQLLMENPIDVFERHTDAIAKYAAFSEVSHTYDILYNTDTSGDKNNPVSVKSETRNLWATPNGKGHEGQNYLADLILDAEGKSNKTSSSPIVGKIRSGAAVAAITGNPKVLATQWSSLLASTSVLKGRNLAKGLFMKAVKGDIDQYSRVAKDRNLDDTALRAMANVDTTTVEKARGALGKFTDFLLGLIGKSDRAVVTRLWGACQQQVAEEQGLKIGTAENKAAAGKLLDRVIYETQQNASPLEKSVAMRSGSEIDKTFTMFRSDAMKVVSRVMQSFGEMKATKSKTAKAKFVRSVGALVTVSFFMAEIASLFRRLYRKEEEDEGKEIATDFFGNLIGGLPVITDAYEFATKGYEVEDFTFSAVNDLMNGFMNLTKVFGNVIDGTADAGDVGSAAKQVLTSGGAMLGVPVRNLYNFAYGITKRVSPSTAYAVDTVTRSNISYLSDLQKAERDGDEKLADTIMGYMIESRTGKTEAGDVIGSLYSKGYSVLPKSVGKQITYTVTDENGDETEETVKLKGSQLKQFKATYGKATPKVEAAVKSKAFASLTEKAQAKAIKKIYDTYYNAAFAEVTGIRKDTVFATAAKAMDISKLSVLVAGMSVIESDRDRNGNAVSGTKKKKTVQYLSRQGLSTQERIFLLAYNGYTITDGDIVGVTKQRAKRMLAQYISKINATAEEKAELAKKCGLEVSGNRILASNFR